MIPAQLEILREVARYSDDCGRDVSDSVGAALEEIERLQAFKNWTHDYLDRQGVPHHPPGIHGAEGCRIGDRMDWLTGQLGDARAERDFCHALFDEAITLCGHDHAGPRPGLVDAVRALARERDQAVAVAAARAGGDPEVRRVLLDEVGTAEAELLRETLRNRREQAAGMFAALSSVRLVLWDAESIAEHRYAADRATCSPWPELRDCAARLHALLGGESGPEAAERGEVARLKKLLGRDHTGLASALASVRRIVGYCSWIPAGEWGCYEEHERTEAALRAEVGFCFGEVDRLAETALRESGTRAGAAFAPERDEVERLRGFLRRIRDMAAEDLRKNLVAPCGSIRQIEADARQGLGEDVP